MSDRIREELEQIRETHGGILRPEDVVDFAADPETALHSQFEWDDSEAARQHRIWQARQVIRCVVTVIPQANEPIRAYVSLVPDRSNPGGGYRDTVAVLSDDEHREQLLSQALRELRAWRAKYNQLKALAPVFAAIDTVDTGGKRKARPAPAVAARA